VTVVDQVATPPAIEKPAPSDDVVDEATTPLPRRPQISFRPAYTFPNGQSRYKAELLFETILPYQGIFIPGTDTRGFWSVARLQLPALSQQSGDTVSQGLGDLRFTNLAGTRLGPLNLALGFASIFPMATDPALGQNKIQLGPAVGVRLPVSFLNVAFLVQNLYSIAGDSQAPNLAYVTVQPFITLHLPADFFLSTDAQMTFAWRGGQGTVPVDLGLGRAFGDHFVGALQFWYTLAEANQGDIRVRAVLDFEP
jgi:hypothetical protein